MVNSLIANYNISNVQGCNTTTFRGTHSNRGCSRTPSFTSQPDTVELSINKKQGLSNGAKWGIGLGLTALASVGIYFATRGKVGAKQAKQVAEHIDFKEAKSMEEAIEFAKKNFGIKLNLGDNLFTANLVNECCVNVSNSMQGKAHFPSELKFGIVNNSRAAAGYDAISKTMLINNQKTGWGVDFYKIFNNMLKTKNGYLEYKKLLQSNNNPVYNDMIETIFHELGHCNHSAICKDYKKMGKLKEITCSDKSITIEFLNNKTIQNTANKVSSYAKESPAEFVAETFAGLLSGKKYSDDVMALYKKYGGPSI